jgi:2-isopropylmalate synthase
MKQGEKTWSTVGVGSDVIKASIDAITDGYLYGILMNDINNNL